MNLTNPAALAYSRSERADSVRNGRDPLNDFYRLDLVDHLDSYLYQPACLSAYHYRSHIYLWTYAPLNAQKF